MEVKKSNKINPDNYKWTWYLMGIIIVLAFLFIALEWNVIKKEKPAVFLEIDDDELEKILLPIVLPEEPLPAPPPPPTESEIIYIITRTDDDSTGGKGDLEIIETDESVEISFPILYKLIPEEEIMDGCGGHPLPFEQMPEFPGGDKALMEFLKKNVRYPNNARELGKQGRVVVQFSVGKDGTITDEKIIQSIDKYLDNEVLRLVNLMPNWKPGKIGGKPVTVKYTLPVKFDLKEL